MKLLAGTSGYSYKEWLGPFYPGASDQRDAALLRRRFTTVESTTRSTACRRNRCLRNGRSSARSFHVYAEIAETHHS